MSTKYQKFMSKPAAERKADIEKQLAKTPDRVGVLVRGKPEIRQYKFLVRDDRPIMDLQASVRSRLINEHPDEFNTSTALFMFVKEQGKKDARALMANETMGTIAQDYAWDDGFVHVEYGLENTFG